MQNKKQNDTDSKMKTFMVNHGRLITLTGQLKIWMKTVVSPEKKLLLDQLKDQLLDEDMKAQTRKIQAIEDALTILKS